MKRLKILKNVYKSVLELRFTLHLYTREPVNLIKSNRFGKDFVTDGISRLGHSLIPVS
jgi:hypothetical protein